MKIGANSLTVFGSWDMETAFKYLKRHGGL